MELYKMNETNSHKFYQVPKDLLENPCYRYALTSDAKMVYALLLDRMSLSKKNGWINDRDEIFLLYTKEHVADILGISTPTTYKAFKLLEQCKLIKQERQGLNKPNKIYVAKVDFTFSIASIKELARTCKICRSGCVNSLCQDIKNIDANYTELNETDINETDNILTLPNKGEIDNPFWIIYRQEYKKCIGKNHPRIKKEQINYVEQALNVLSHHDIEQKEFREQAIKHLTGLPKKNNGNILAFLKAGYRYFQVDLERIV